MDLSIVVFDLRDAIEELREERADLLKRIEALEASALHESEKPAEADTIQSEENGDRSEDEKNHHAAPAIIASPLRDAPKDDEPDYERNDLRGKSEQLIHSGILPRGGTR
jgi:hypothetical protein